MFTLKIKTGNAAFQDEFDDSAAHEVSRILLRLSEQLGYTAVKTKSARTGMLRDNNGNQVGEWKLTAR